MKTMYQQSDMQYHCCWLSIFACETITTGESTCGYFVYVWQLPLPFLGLIASSKQRPLSSVFLPLAFSRAHLFDGIFVLFLKMFG